MMGTSVVGVILLFLALIGIVIYIVNDLKADNRSTDEEWPVFAETEQSYQIHTLKGFLEDQGISVIVEEESSEAGGLPTNITRARLRVKPGQQQEAKMRLEESDFDTKNFDMKDLD